MTEGPVADNIQGALHKPVPLGSKPKRKKNVKQRLDDLASLVKAFDPDEPRDPKGQWTDDGSGSIYYHGTIESALDDIKKNGLVPGKGQGGDYALYVQGQISKEDLPKRQTKVFLSNDPQKAWLYGAEANNASFKQGRKTQPVVLAIRVPKDKLGQLKVDPADPGEGSVTFKGKVPPKWIEAVHVGEGKDYDPGAMNIKFNWQRFQKSADDDGTLIYALFFVTPELKKVARTLYVSRPVLNAEEIIKWAKNTLGLATCIAPEDMHVTLAFSRNPVQWPKALRDLSLTVRPQQPTLALFGPDKNCLVLKFHNDELTERWAYFLSTGASWDWPGYEPHITLSYNWPSTTSGFDSSLPDVSYDGEIVFGPEKFAEVNEDWKDGVVEKFNHNHDNHGRFATATGADSDHGVVPPKLSDDEWNRILSESKERHATAEQHVNDVLGSKNNMAVYTDPDRPKRKLVISRSLDARYGLRATDFDERGPLGHREYSTGDRRGIHTEISDALAGDMQRTALKRLEDVEKAGPPDEPRDKDGRWTGTPSKQFDADKHKRMREAQGLKLDEDEEETIGNYTHNADETNDALREGKISPSDLGVDDLDRAFKRASLAEPVTAYRFVSPNAEHRLMMNVGKTFREKGYVSTTDNVPALANRSPNLKNWLLVKVELPKGAPAIPIADLSEHPDESEILVNRNQTFKVTGSGNNITLKWVKSGKLKKDGVVKLNQDSAHLWDIEKFDPNQLRDEHGRWADEGGDSASAAQLLRSHSTGDETMADVEKQLTPEQIARVNAAEESLKGKGTTMSQYKDANGVYSPERAALHQKIVDNMFTPEKVAAATPAPGETPTLTMTGGRPAAGKTSALRDELKDVNDKSFYLSADEIQEKLPGYKGELAGLYNGEAQDITAQAEKVARAARLNITYDATMKTGKTALERVDEYKKDGYKVNAYFVHTSPLTSAVRSVERFERSGRYVPMAVALNSRSNESTFDSLKSHVDKWALYDNNGSAPKLVARSKA